MNVNSSSAVLIVKLGAIGDVIMVLPAVRALHEQGAEIDWVCGRGVAPLLACYPWIRTIVIDDKALLKGGKTAQARVLLKLWPLLRKRRYDLCATLYYDSRYRWITMPVRARRKISLSRMDRRVRLLPGRHHTDEYARLLLGLEDGKRTLSLAPIRPENLPPSTLMRPAGTVRIVMAPAGAKNMMRDDVLRRWPAENYAGIAKELLESGFEVVLVGGPDDEWITPTFDGIGVNNLIGRLSLVETIALIDECDVMVTHDTGPLHMAGITRAGIVTIFGPTNPWARLPRRADAVAIWGGEGFACRPCYDGVNYAPCKDNGCMKQVTVAMVMQQIEAVLEQRRNGSQPPRVVLPQSTVTVKL